MVKNKISAVLEGLYLFASITLLVFLMILLINSINYMSANSPYNEPLQTKLFYISLMITVITVITQWMEGRINAIIETILSFKRRYEEWQKKKSTRA